MIAELFRRAVLDSQDAPGATRYQVQLLWQSSRFLMLFTLVTVFMLVALFFALRRFGNRASPLLIYVVCGVAIYVAFCIKKTRSSGSGVHSDENFYRNSSRLSLSEKLTAAASSDYIVRKVAYLLGRNTGRRAVAGLAFESSGSLENEEGGASEGLKKASESYRGEKHRKDESEVGTVKKSRPQAKHATTNSLVSLEHTGTTGHAGRAGAQGTEEVKQDRGVKGGKKGVGTDTKEAKDNKHTRGFSGYGSLERGSSAADKNEAAEGKQGFFREVQGQIDNKKRIDSQLYKLNKRIQLARAHAASLVEALRKDYRVFFALSQSIKDKLLSAVGISTDLYAYELDELEEEILKKYTIHELGGRGDTERQRSVVKDRKAVNLYSENPNAREGTNSQVLGALKRIKDTEERFAEDGNGPQNFGFIKQRLYAIELYLTLEGIASLVLILMILAEMYEYVAIFRFVLIVALLINIYVGLFILADGKTLESHCQRRMLEGCKQDMHEVNEIVQLLNQDAKLEHQVDVINKEFARISSDTKHQIQAIRKYLAGSLNSHVDVKVLVFETFIDKLKSIEENFVEITGGSIDRVAFYNTVDAMQKDLENIKGFVKSMNVAKILDVYQELFQVEFFFGSGRKRVADKIKSIVEADTNELGRKKKRECIDFIEGICNSQKEHDSLSFILMLFPVIFVVLLLL